MVRVRSVPSAAALLVLAPPLPANTLTITFETRSDCTPIQVGGAGWGEISCETFSPGLLLDSLTLVNGGFSREPPFYYNFTTSGQIARGECWPRYVGIDEVIITEVSIPVAGSIWGAIKIRTPSSGGAS